jgi:anti-sigma B factor antagonist
MSGEQRECFSLSLTPEGDVVMLRIEGEVGRDQVAAVEERLNDLVGQGHCRLVLDLSAAERMSSTGYGLVLYYQTIFKRRGGRLVLVAPSATLSRQMALTGLDSAYEICPSVEEALEKVRRGRSSRTMQPAGV